MSRYDIYRDFQVKPKIAWDKGEKSPKLVDRDSIRVDTSKLLLKNLKFQSSSCLNGNICINKYCFLLFCFQICYLLKNALDLYRDLSNIKKTLIVKRVLLERQSIDKRYLIGQSWQFRNNEGLFQKKRRRKQFISANSEYIILAYLETYKEDLSSELSKDYVANLVTIWRVFKRYNYLPRTTVHIYCLWIMNILL